VLALLAGCGDSGSDLAATQASPVPTARDEVLHCGHHEIPLERLESPRSATALPRASKQALRLDAPNDFDLSDYTIVDNEPDFASIIGTVPLDKRVQYAPGTYDYRAAKFVAPEPGKPRAWMLWSAGVPVLEMTPEQVRLAIGVVPRDGRQTCQGNPVTPFTLDLPEPLGARKLIDVSAYPEHEITVPQATR
jgi:hypothetical protein